MNFKTTGRFDGARRDRSIFGEGLAAHLTIKLIAFCNKIIRESKQIDQKIQEIQEARERGLNALNRALEIIKKDLFVSNEEVNQLVQSVELLLQEIDDPTSQNMWIQIKPVLESRKE